MSMYFGLDFGNSSLKAVSVTGVNTNSFVLSGVGLVQNPAGSVDFLDAEVVKKLAPAVKNLISQSGIHDKRAVISIPESKVYSKIVSMPTMSDAELSSAVKWEAEQFVPVPVSEVEIDYQVVKEARDSTQGQSLVYLVAAPKKLLQAMVDFVISIGIEPIAIESEMVAVSRSMMHGVESKGSTLLMHIGALSTVMGIVDSESLSFSHYMNTGGVAMTRGVSQLLSLPIAQAEEYKRTYGLDSGQLEGKVRESLMIVMESIVGEVRKAIEYHATSNKGQVNKIVFSGGGAYLPELSSFFGERFEGIEIMIGDPFAYAKIGRDVQVPQEKSAYAVAAGLALRIF
jgi:type IV pilus assembly protein PilM